MPRFPLMPQTLARRGAAGCPQGGTMAPAHGRVVWPAAVILLSLVNACALPASQPTPSPTPDQVVEGAQLFRANCAQCHGERGQGQTTVPSAPALDDTEHAWHHPDWQLRQFIRDGKFSFGPVEMPAFGDQLSDQEIDAVIAYLKSLWSDEQRAVQEDLSRRSLLPTPTPQGAG